MCKHTWSALKEEMWICQSSSEDSCFKYERKCICKKPRCEVMATEGYRWRFWLSEDIHILMFLLFNLVSLTLPLTLRCPWISVNLLCFLILYSFALSSSGVCGCCGALRPRYKRLVDNIFPEDPEVGPESSSHLLFLKVMLFELVLPCLSAYRSLMKHSNKLANILAK